MTKETKARLIHAALAVATIALGVVVDIFDDNHAVWAPIVVALAVNLRTLITKAPSVTGLALLFGVSLIAAGAQGCGDDVQPFYRIGTCIDGREAWRAGTELYCYEVDGSPLTPRPWRPDETLDTACDYCEEFLPPGGAT
jgi:hypothetical protein